MKTILQSKILVISLCIAVRFVPDCSLVFTARRDGVIIDCSTPEDSQTIAAVEYKINGVDKGPGRIVSYRA